MEGMKMGMRAAGLVALLALAGCFSLGRAEPEQQHYVLGAHTSPADAAGPSDRSGLTVGLRRLRIASYLEAPYLVVREEPGRVSYAEFHRWAEPLDGGISRAIAGRLADRNGIRAVDLAPWPVRERYDYVVQIHVDRFEGVAGAGIEGGEAYVQASWEIIRQSDGSVLERGVTEHREPGWRAGDYPGLVRLLDAGLQAIAADLARSLDRLGVPQSISRNGGRDMGTDLHAGFVAGTGLQRVFDIRPEADTGGLRRPVLRGDVYLEAGTEAPGLHSASPVSRWTS